MTDLVTLLIENNEIKVKKGVNLLWAALDNGYYIPNLCSMRHSKQPVASCRLCFVEIGGRNEPVTSCNQIVYDGMVVNLNTEKVKKIRSTAFELLLSHHPVDCAHCDKNRNCGLQQIAAKLGLRLKLSKFHPITRDLPINNSHPLFYYNPNKCVLCGRCIQICNEKGNGTLDFAYRGIYTLVSTFAGIPLVEACGDSCLSCVAVCPVGSLVIKPGVSQLRSSVT